MMSEFPQPPRLPRPLRITEQVWPEGTVPVVSIWCITYNHAKFIRGAIKGFLMQETTFPVEIFIHDDASTDRTAEIIKKYEDKYPQLFWTVLQTENQWSKGNRKIFFEYLAKQRGEFVALCEGDDYWASPQKLQKQVELLESEPKAAAVSHWVQSIDAAGEPTPIQYLPKYETAKIGSGDFLDHCKATTCSVVLKRSLAGFPDSWKRSLPMGDWPLFLSLALKGEFHCIPEAMASYRQHAGGMWSGKAQLVRDSWPLLFLSVVYWDLPKDLHGRAQASWQRHAQGVISNILSQRGISEGENLRLFVRSKLQQLGVNEDIPSPLAVLLDDEIRNQSYSFLLISADRSFRQGDRKRAAEVYNGIAVEFGADRRLAKRMLAVKMPVFGELAFGASSRLSMAIKRLKQWLNRKIQKA
jgi:glycosyltransferase involved in cell wall biosynthesis